MRWMTKDHKKMWDKAPSTATFLLSIAESIGLGLAFARVGAETWIVSDTENGDRLWGKVMEKLANLDILPMGPAIDDGEWDILESNDSFNGLSKALAEKTLLEDDAAQGSNKPKQRL